MAPDGEQIKKLKSEPKDEDDIKKEKKLEKDLSKQNDLFHKYRRRLTELAKTDVQELLEANSQEILQGPDEIDRSINIINILQFIYDFDYFFVL